MTQTQINRTTPPPVGATVLGYPRIGRDRELKHGLDRYWSGRLDLPALERITAAVRRDALATMRAAGLRSGRQ